MPNFRLVAGFALVFMPGNVMFLVVLGGAWLEVEGGFLGIKDNVLLEFHFYS